MNRLDEIEAKLTGGEIITYEDAADIFENTVIGRSIGKTHTRADLIARMREKYPTVDALTAVVREAYAAFHAMKRATKH